MNKHHKKTIKGRLLAAFRSIGPGFITGAADDDPSGIATYAQTGARFGYNQLWLSFLTLPFMIVVQEMCGRIGLVKGRGLAAAIRERYGKKVVVFAVSLLLLANTVNIGADLGAMASTMQLLWNLPFAFWLIAITALILILQIFVSYKTYANLLKYLTLSLFAYVATAFIVKQDWSQIFFATFVPQLHWSQEYLFNIVALFGTIISPYLFFWQASEEVEEEVMHHKLEAMDVGTPRIGRGDIRRMRIDTVIGMVFSNLMTFFIIVTAASTLGVHGLTQINTASEAAEALRPLAGNLTYLLFAVGIIGTGLLAVPVLAGSASYAIAETLGWKSGLYLKLKDAHGFYGIITIATLIGLLINFTPIQPFQMLYYSAAFNGILAPPLIVIILLLANDKSYMGQYRNRPISNIMGWLIAGVMGVCGAGLVAQWIF